MDLFEDDLLRPLEVKGLQILGARLVEVEGLLIEVEHLSQETHLSQGMQTKTMYVSI